MEERDEKLYAKAVSLSKHFECISTTIIQRKLRVNYEKANQFQKRMVKNISEWTKTEDLPLPIIQEPFIAKWHGISCLCQFDQETKTYHLVFYPAENSVKIKVPFSKCSVIKEWKHL